MHKPILITFFEHEKKRIDEIKKEVPRFRKRDLYEKIKALNKKMFRGSEEEGIFTLYSESIKAKNYVGFALLGKFIVEVLPKIYKNAEGRGVKEEARETFLRMLNLTEDLKIYEDEFAVLREKKFFEHGILEILIYLFARGLLKELKRGIYRRYEEIEEESRYLKGKLLVEKQIRKNEAKKHLFSIRRAEHSKDNLMNKVFLKAAIEALKYTTWRNNKRKLKEIVALLDEVSLARITFSDLRKVTFTRLNERFRRPFTLAKVILFSLGALEKSKSYGFFVDMNCLFEEYLAKILEKELSKEGYEILYQEPLGSLDKDHLIEQRPDILIRKRKRILIALDAKYKELETEGSKPKINPADYYQLYAYLRMMKIGEGKKTSPVAVLVYPHLKGVWNSKMASENKIVGEITFRDGGKLLIMLYDLDAFLERKDRGIDQEFVKTLLRYVKEREKAEV